jgi:AhpD family alkylhydroperoxidase
MKSRLEYAKVAPGVYDAMDALDQYVSGAGLEPGLLALVRLRASQINGCAYCLESHARELRELGESAHRIDTLRAWRECPWYSPRERAALEWTEAITLIARDQAPDELHQRVSAHFSARELCDLTLAIATINAWNRLSIAARLLPSVPAEGARS